MTTITIKLLPDYDASPTDYDCYDAEQIAAWHRDDWRFVGVIVKVEEDKDGHSKTYESWGLWGVDWDGSDETYVRTVAAEQYDDMRSAFPELPIHQDWLMARIVETDK